MDIEKVIEQVKSYNPEADFEFIKKAYRIAAIAHKGQQRLSGEPFISHPLWVAYILAELKLDGVTIAAGLLHDVVEDTILIPEEIKEFCGDEIAGLVDGVTKLRDIARQSRETRRVENLRKMLLAMATDIRVILIKLADRLHNMRTLGSLSRDCQIRVAHETKEIYAPLAHRLGIGRIKAELEDLALLYLEPEIYKGIKEKVAADRERRQAYIAEATKILEEKLKEVGIKAAVTGRPKHYYSIYRKMISQNKTFEEIHDLFALRVITNSIKDCYGAFGVVHAIWKARPGRFKDYINMPKTNMYQAIHTTVMGPHNRLMEVQVKTKEMHEVAESGVAAHWRYKEGKPGDARFDEKLAWLRRVVQTQEELGDEGDFMDGVMSDLFADEVFVFTPKGEIKALPRGSTPIDFAYAIHTDVGSHCKGARVNNRIVPLRYKLISGDIVEIMTSPRAHPSRDWLDLVKTVRARGRIRQWLKSRVEEEGGEKAPHKEEIGRDLHPPSPPPPVKHHRRASSTGVRVSGVMDMDVRFAKCCNPVPGDKIVGYVTQGRGVSVHRKGCSNIFALPDISKRRLPVSWDQDSSASFEVGITALAHDRSGLMADMLAIISATQTTINAADARRTNDGMATCHFTVLISNQAELETILKALEKVPGVVKTHRTKPI